MILDNLQKLFFVCVITEYAQLVSIGINYLFAEINVDTIYLLLWEGWLLESSYKSK